MSKLNMENFREVCKESINSQAKFGEQKYIGLEVASPNLYAPETLVETEINSLVHARVKWKSWMNGTFLNLMTYFA